MINKESVSLIIPTYNKLPRLKLMIASLHNVSNVEDTEIIIVNDGSTDGTAEYLEDYKKNSQLDIKVLNVENGGRSVARNVGVKNASNERLIFCDDDMILDKKFIKEHVRRLNLSDKNIVHGFIYTLSFIKFFLDPEKGILFDEYKSAKDRKSLFKFCISSEVINKDFDKIIMQGRLTKFEKDIQQLFVEENKADTSQYTWISSNGGNLSMYKDRFLKAGGFNESMGKSWGVEDLELGYRLHLNGAQFHFAPDAVNYHMAHYRADAINIHDEAFKYFRKKHNDAKLDILQRYFDGSIRSLIEWKGICENGI